MDRESEKNYEKLVMIVSRASGAPVVANALRFAGELVKGKVFEVAKEEFKLAKRAGLEEILSEIREANKPKESGEEVKEPPKEVVTAALFGIEVTDLDDAVRCLWKLRNLCRIRYGLYRTDYPRVRSQSREVRGRVKGKGIYLLTIWPCCTLSDKDSVL